MYVFKDSWAERKVFGKFFSHFHCGASTGKAKQFVKLKTGVDKAQVERSWKESMLKRETMEEKNI